MFSITRFDDSRFLFLNTYFNKDSMREVLNLISFRATVERIVNLGVANIVGSFTFTWRILQEAATFAHD